MVATDSLSALAVPPVNTVPVVAPRANVQALVQLVGTQQRHQMPARRHQPVFHVWQDDTLARLAARMLPVALRVRPVVPIGTEMHPRRVSRARPADTLVEAP